MKNALIAKPASIILGDSIAAGLSRYPEIWSNFFSNFSNFGIGGDRVQHIIWRAENMEFEHSIKSVLLQCGTNNIENDSSFDIVNGIICAALIILQRNKSTSVIISGLLPRGEKNTNIRKLIKSVNIMLSKECSKLAYYNIFFLEPSTSCIEKNGDLDLALFSNDKLHLHVIFYYLYMNSWKISTPSQIQNYHSNILRQQFH